ncbi:MAG: hypothetical protein RL095_177 [Verrucomicrobiota bacterium]|jgi:hypothetical protein
MKLLIAVFFLTSLGAWAQGFHERAPNNYSGTSEQNAATLLNRRLEAGELRLEVKGGTGRLEAVLAALKVPASSQMLVSSKTSFHRDLISPQNPRAVYYGPDAYVGWVKGAGVLEVAVGDPKLGLVFYTLSQDSKVPPRFRRDDACLSCHGTSRTGNEPGLVIRSIFPDDKGRPISSAGEAEVETSTPFEQRWGGWLVTGRFEGRHRGNGVAVKRGESWVLEPMKAADLKAFSKDFDASVYLRPSSDVGTLMVFEQQATLHNLLIRGALQVRCLLESDREINELLGQSGPREQSVRIIGNLAKEIAASLLLKGEPDLSAAKIIPDAAFAADFAALWPASSAGERLGALEMKSQLFRLPLSPMIHSPAFEVLPAELKSAAFKELRSVLEGGGAWPEGVKPMTAEMKFRLHRHLLETVKGY